MTIHCPSGMFAFSKQLDRKGKTFLDTQAASQTDTLLQSECRLRLD